ncbi:MAG: radical SAM protein [Deltaproteobacteria bacterium]|nr:radical SAM protein [Deltaproteobacteria bacterium]
MEFLDRFFKSGATANTSDLPYLVDQPEETYSGTRISPIKYGLPKEIDSICPECMEIIRATLYSEEGKVWITKTCKDHGEFKDIFYGDVNLYFRCEDLWFGDGKGVEDPAIKKATVCPKQCGLCNMHMSHSGLPIIDLTNRCNMSCPVCFANANAAGYLYEPSFESVMKMLESLASQKPVRANRVQFSGGEPTVRPDFLEIVRRTRAMDFDYIQINTNGIKMSEFEFASAAKEAGVDNIYLQFDGVSDDVYKKTRSRTLIDTKMSAIGNCRKLKIGVVLVATMVKGFNDHQVGDIVRFAVKNNDVISGIAFQPVSFVGRFSQSHRLERRYTLADLAHDIEKQTGYIDVMRDWFPIGVTSAISKLASALSGKPAFTLSLHPHCSQGTYFYIGDDGAVKPISEFLDMLPFLKELIELSRTVKPSRFDLLSKVKILYKLKKHFIEEKAPKGLTFEKFLKSLEGYQERDLRKTNTAEEEKKDRFDRNFFIAGMHFMDAYNFSVERVMRCVIHYPDPNGHLYPFCAYNGAPVYRKKVESKFKLSPDELKEKIISEGRPKELELIAKKMGL